MICWNKDLLKWVKRSDFYVIWALFIIIYILDIPPDTKDQSKLPIRRALHNSVKKIFLHLVCPLVVGD